MFGNATVTISPAEQSSNNGECDGGVAADNDADPPDVERQKTTPACNNINNCKSNNMNDARVAAAASSARFRVGIVCVAPAAADNGSGEHSPRLRAGLESVRVALTAAGHKVTVLGPELATAMKSSRFDLCFLVSPGNELAYRPSQLPGEAHDLPASKSPQQVPALLELLGIPYTSSRPAALSVALGAATMFQALQYHGVRVPSFHTVHSPEELDGAQPLPAGLTFPLLVRPAGVAPDVFFRVDDLPSLRAQVNRIATELEQPALVHTYLRGRCVSVGVVGNRLRRGEAPLSDKYDASGYRLFVPDVPNYETVRCAAVAAFEALGCCDVARIHLRVGESAEEAPYIVGADLLPPLDDHDGAWADCAAEVAADVLLLAARRWGVHPRERIPKSLPHSREDFGCLKHGNVPKELWDDWKWQMSHRLTTKEHFASILQLTTEEIEAFDAPGHFPVAVTPYFASLIKPDDPNDPIRKEVLPSCHEVEHVSEDIEDSLGEDAHSPVPGLVHRYPDRCLMLVSMICASYCRFCTRNRVVGTGLQGLRNGDAMGKDALQIYQAQLDYIRRTPQIRDVLLSGGDPLLLPKRTLDYLLTQLRSIPHIQVVRIGSRAPIFLPQRITPSLCAMLSKHHPLWMNVHVNHPNELSPESAAALGRLANAGIPLGCQTVLLAGVNDCPNIMKALVHKLVACRVRPYYIYQCDLVVGAHHFRTPVAKGIEIIESLRGHTSGFCVPQFIIDSPHGGGKVPLQPNYLISQSDTKIIVRNYEGYIATYTQPTGASYAPHNPATCSYCRRKAGESHQEGVAGLLQGVGTNIKPSSWDHIHARKTAAGSNAAAAQQGDNRTKQKVFKKAVPTNCGTNTTNNNDRTTLYKRAI
eukprot:TRINITY_DN4687_c0_g1_i1.p1 TRINITY_DN4687_c0_g1~~TRINITY_DN4687_c0_g1_i1.p1  ORF type:complete len:871 (+),score=229.92 TRINITY_DN4687_c0_g1_i1:138-2750(+)